MFAIIWWTVRVEEGGSIVIPATGTLDGFVSKNAAKVALAELEARQEELEGIVVFKGET